MMGISTEKVYSIDYILRSACILYGGMSVKLFVHHAHVAALEAGYGTISGCICQFGKRKYILYFKTKDEIESYSRVSLRLSVDSRP